MVVLKILFFPLIYLVMLPIEYPLWKLYLAQGYNVPAFYIFLWRRNFGPIERNFYEKVEKPKT